MEGGGEGYMEDKTCVCVSVCVHAHVRVCVEREKSFQRSEDCLLY